MLLYNGKLMLWHYKLFIFLLVCNISEIERILCINTCYRKLPVLGGAICQNKQGTPMLNGIVPASWSGHLHAALRIVTGLLFLEHGTSKYFKFPLTEYFADGVQVFSLMGLAGGIEIIGGILIILGLFTRITAFVLAGEMAAAYFMAHIPMSFFPLLNEGESAILFCFIFLYLAAVGAGPWSLDAKQK